MAKKINTYDVGDVVRVSALFTDKRKRAHDPTTVTFKFLDPSADTTTYVYGTDDELVKVKTGCYYVDISIDEAGTWYHRWISTGTGQAAEENQLEVRTPKIS